MRVPGRARIIYQLTNKVDKDTCSSATSPCRCIRRRGITSRLSKRIARRSCLADKLGYTEAFVGEHVTDLAETITSCVTFIASLIHDTKQIKLGTGTVNLPNNHPAQVAATVAMIG